MGWGAITASARPSLIVSVDAAIGERLEIPGCDYWIATLTTAGVACDRVMTLPEIFAGPQTRDQEMVVAAEHAGYGELNMLGFPIKFAEPPCHIRRPAPDFGVDSDAVLRASGYSNDDIARLCREGVANQCMT